MKLTIRIFCLLFFIATLAEAATQRKIPSYEKYIKTYSALAIEQQKKYKIPASITLAQGLLESGAGQSDLARRTQIEQPLRHQMSFRLARRTCLS